MPWAYHLCLACLSSSWSWPLNLASKELLVDFMASLTEGQWEVQSYQKLFQCKGWHLKITPVGRYIISRKLLFRQSMLCRDIFFVQVWRHAITCWGVLAGTVSALLLSLARHLCCTKGPNSELQIPNAKLPSSHQTTYHRISVEKSCLGFWPTFHLKQLNPREANWTRSYVTETHHHQGVW